LVGEKKLCQYGLTALWAMEMIIGAAVPQAQAAESLTITVDDAAELALKNHRSIEQAAWGREQASWQLSEARRSSGPTFSWSTGVSHIGGRDFEGRRRQHDMAMATPGVDMRNYPAYDYTYSNSWTIAIPIYTGGKLENTRKAAAYRLNAADLNLENVRQNVRYQTRSACYQMLQNRELINVHQEAVRTLAMHLKEVSLQYEEGAVAYADVLASKVQLANEEQAVRKAEGEYQKSMVKLNILMGLPSQTVIALQDSLEYKPYGYELPDSIAYAVKYRPDKISAYYNVKQAEAAKEAAKAGWRPAVTASATESLSGEKAFQKNQSQSWSVGMTVNWNVFDNQLTEARVKAAEAELHAAESKLRDVEETIAGEVQIAYADLLTAERNISTTKNAVEMAEQEYHIAQVRYNEGVDTNLAVMRSQEKLTEARTNYLNAIYGYNNSQAALDKAMGIPVVIDAGKYTAAEQKGLSSVKALAASVLPGAKAESQAPSLRKSTSKEAYITGEQPLVQTEGIAKTEKQVAQEMAGDK